MCSHQMDTIEYVIIGDKDEDSLRTTLNFMKFGTFESSRFKNKVSQKLLNSK